MHRGASPVHCAYSRNWSPSSLLVASLLILLTVGGSEAMGVTNNLSPGLARTSRVIHNSIFTVRCPNSDDPGGYSPREDAGYVEFDVAIEGASTRSELVSVEVVTVPLTADAGLDFTTLRTTVGFEPSETRKRLKVDLVNDDLIEPGEAFKVVLQNPSGALIGSPSEFIVWMKDNDLGYSIESSPDSQPSQVPESVGAARVQVYRDGDFQFASSVAYRTVANTALPGRDYVDTVGELTFGPGETNKTLAIAILDNHGVQGPRIFSVELTGSSDKVAVFNSGPHVIQIDDDEWNPLRVDPNFGSAFPYARGAWDEGGNGLQSLPDGRIVMPTPLWRPSGEEGVAIVRLLPDGRQDSTFGLVPVRGLRTLLAQPDGSVWLAGGQLQVAGRSIRHLARLGSDGSLDLQFSALLPTPVERAVIALAGQDDGKAIVATDNGRIYRLLGNGRIDPDFRTFALRGVVRRMVLDEQNRILIGNGEFFEAGGQTRPGLARLLPNGQLDQRFLNYLPFSAPRPVPIQQFELEPGGTILARYQSRGGPTLARFNADGTIVQESIVDPALRLTYFLVATNRLLIFTETRYGSGSVSLLNPDGTSDSSFPPGSYQIGFPESGIWNGGYFFNLTPAGNLLVRGDSLEVNGHGARTPLRVLLNSPAQRLEVHPESTYLRERNDHATIKLIRTGDSFAALVVNWSTEAGTAQPGVDFLTASGTTTFPAGGSEQSIFIPLLDNNEPSEDRTLRLLFTTADRRSLPPAHVRIANDDLGLVAAESRRLPNGSFLLKLTGHRGRANVWLQRCTFLGEWKDWFEAVNESEILDIENSTVSSAYQYYRLTSD